MYFTCVFTGFYRKVSIIVFFFCKRLFKWIFSSSMCWRLYMV